MLSRTVRCAQTVHEVATVVLDGVCGGSSATCSGLLPSGWWLTRLENASLTVSANSRSRRPLIFVHLTIQRRCARTLSFQTRRRFTVSVANPVQLSTLKQYLADPRNNSLSLLDRHPSYTTGEEGRQQEYQPS